MTVPHPTGCPSLPAPLSHGPLSRLLAQQDAYLFIDSFHQLHEALQALQLGLQFGSSKTLCVQVLGVGAVVSDGGEGGGGCHRTGVRWGGLFASWVRWGDFQKRPGSEPGRMSRVGTGICLSVYLWS